LLVAAGKTANLLLRRLTADIVFFAHLLGIGAHGFFLEPPAARAAEFALLRALEQQVFFHGHIADKPHAIAVFRDMRNASADEVRRGKARNRAALEHNMPRFRADNAGNDLRKLALAVSVHARNAEDFAFAYGQ
jgi:hypothetical protein